MCGVAGVLGPDNAAVEIFLALTNLQHRGQDAAGICSFDPQVEPSLNIAKGLGLASKAMAPQQLEGLTGQLAIGHTRYATVGKTGDQRNIQPMVTNFPLPIAMAHNGNLVNYFSLKEKLETNNGFSALTGSDLELILRVFVDALSDRGLGSKTAHAKGPKIDFEDLTYAVTQVQKECIGAYAVVGFIGNQGLFAFCDPHGIRPLCFGIRQEQSSKSYMVASEDNTLRFLGYQTQISLKPGELIWVTEGQEVKKTTINPQPLRACMFEWVYFAGAESSVWDRPVYGARLNLGKALADVIKCSPESAPIDIVVPVPETSRTAAIALSETLNLPYREALIKNRYIQRSFIINVPSERSKAVELKLSPVVSEIKNKNILLVDDSIVRGTTLRRIIQLLRKAGANRVYVASTCPPIRYGCYYGIDFPDKSQLVADNRTQEQIKKELGADEIYYLTTEGLKSSLGLSDLCTACLDAEYPTDVTDAKRFSEARALQKEKVHK